MATMQDIISAAGKGAKEIPGADMVLLGPPVPVVRISDQQALLAVQVNCKTGNILVQKVPNGSSGWCPVSKLRLPGATQ